MRNHRYLALLFALATVISIASPAAGAGPTTKRHRIEKLTADFIIPTKTEGSYRWLGIHGQRVTNLDTGRITVSGYPIRGTCSGDETGFNMSCYGAGVSGWKMHRFEADESMSFGVVVMKRGERVIRIRFTGGAPFPTGSQVMENDCGGSTTETYPLTRNATAEGRLLGQRVSTADESEGNRAAERMSIIERTRQCP